MRAQRKGAATYIGATNLTYWYEDFQWALGPMAQSVALSPTTAGLSNTGLGVYDRMWHNLLDVPDDERACSAGEIVFWGNMAVQTGTASSSSSQIAQGRKYYWEIYHVLGDPSYVQSLKIPQTITPGTFLTSIHSHTSEYTVQTNVPYAYVGFSFDGQLLGGGTADASGNITFGMKASTLPIGNAKLVIPAKNHIPYIATVKITDAVSILPENPRPNGGFDVMIQNGQLRIQINAETPSKATIRLVNSIGQPVAAIASNNTVNIGQNDFYFDMSNLPKGLYICTFFDGERTLSQKVVW
jgi:hypothetical protein